MKNIFLLLKIVTFLVTATIANAAWYNVNKGEVNQSSVVTKNNTTTTLVALSNQVQIFNATNTQTVVLPDAQALPLDWWYDFINLSAGDVTIKDYAGTTVATVQGFRQSRLLSKSQATAAGVWYEITNSVSGGGGSVDFNSFSAVSPLSYNGTGEYSIPQASSSSDGYLSAADWVTFSNAASGNFITDLTGDVSAAGPGSAAATVNAVGGKTSTELAANVDDVNAATASNTPGQLVRRDGSGNFAAGTITADLAGNASTSSAFDHTPSACAAGQYATSQAANGDFTCAVVAGGDVSGPASSVDSEIALFSGTGGKTIKSATGTGIAKITSGVLGTATSGTDYAPATSGSSILSGNGSGGFTNLSSTGSGNVVLATAPTIVTPTIAKIANLTTNGYVKTSGGDGTLSAQTTPIPVADGGTGAASLTADGVVIANGTSPLTVVNPGTTGYVLTSNGSGAPSFQVNPSSAPRSEIRCDTAAGYAATNTKVPYFSNCTTTGSDLSVTTNNGTLGLKVTAATTGVYSGVFCYGAGTNESAASTVRRNATTGFTTNASSLSAADLWTGLERAGPDTGHSSTVCFPFGGILTATDFITPQTDGGGGAPAQASFVLYKVAN